ncbi:hypothetical protein [Streptomyces sp. NPDC059122]
MDQVLPADADRADGSVEPLPVLPADVGLLPVRETLLASFAPLQAGFIEQ